MDVELNFKLKIKKSLFAASVVNLVRDMVTIRILIKTTVDAVMLVI